jgi:hypothetical protein
MNGNWGYNRADKNFKSVEQLIGLLVETASKGGNLLLNVGPTSEGLIPEESVARLAGMGRWMQTHASAIRGTTGTPFDHTPYRVTRKGNTLNLFFQPWPAERDVLVPAFDRTPRRAHDGAARGARPAHGRSGHRRAAAGEAVGRDLLGGGRGRIGRLEAPGEFGKRHHERHEQIEGSEASGWSLGPTTNRAELHRAPGPDQTFTHLPALAETSTASRTCWFFRPSSNVGWTDVPSTQALTKSAMV